MLKFYHCNHSVLDMEKSIRFYKEQFGLEVLREITAFEGDLRLAFLGDGISDFRLELTWYKNRKKPFDLGDKEFHVAFYTDNFAEQLAKHKHAGIVKSEETEHHLYFVEDPDGYQIEVVEMPRKEDAS